MATLSCSRGPSGNTVQRCPSSPNARAVHNRFREGSEGRWGCQQCVMCREKPPLSIPQHLHGRKGFASCTTTDPAACTRWTIPGLVLGVSLKRCVPKNSTWLVGEGGQAPTGFSADLHCSSPAMPIMGTLLDFQQIQNHPHLSPLMGHWDKAILGFMSNLEVR